MTLYVETLMYSCDDSVKKYQHRLHVVENMSTAFKSNILSVTSNKFSVEIAEILPINRDNVI